MNPTLHNPVPMESCVSIPKYYSNSGERILGTVVGISSMHVIFQYIVLLDEPLKTPEGTVRAVVVNGPELVGEDGNKNWRIPSPDIVGKTLFLLDLMDNGGIESVSLKRKEDSSKPMILCQKFYSKEEVSEHLHSREFGAISSRLKHLVKMDISSRLAQSGLFNHKDNVLDITIDDSTILIKRFKND